MFKKMLSIVALAAAAFTFGLLQQAAAQNFDMKAGPIYSNDEAKTKCVAACTLNWNNAWVTKVENVMSICSGFNQLKDADGKNYVIMDSNGGLEAGPIFSNAEAQTKCPNALKNVKWNGNWKTTEVNKMSVCGCTGTAVPWRPNVNEK
jgi:hypothetical protein